MVVDIGPVGVRMRETLVLVDVVVSRSARAVTMFVEVVPVVVPVTVDVNDGLVYVRVYMLAQEETSDRRNEEQRCRDVRDSQRLP